MNTKLKCKEITRTIKEIQNKKGERNLRRRYHLDKFQKIRNNNYEVK